MLPYDMLHVVPRQSAPDWIKSLTTVHRRRERFVQIDEALPYSTFATERVQSG